VVVATRSVAVFFFCCNTKDEAFVRIADACVSRVMMLVCTNGEEMAWRRERGGVSVADGCCADRWDAGVVVVVRRRPWAGTTPEGVWWCHRAHM
jgi:hypothetical protein